jgi:hypothetical protein
MIKNFAKKLLIFSTIFSSNIIAQPYVTGLISEQADDITIVTINGTDFGTKDSAAPILIADFSSSDQPSTLGHRSSWSSQSNTDLTIKNVNGSSKQVLRWNASAGSRASLEVHDLLEGNSALEEMYVFVSKMYDFDISVNKSDRGFNLKPYRFWGDLGTEKNNIYWGYQGNEGSSSGRMYAEYTSDGGASWSSAVPQNRGNWVEHELIYKASDIDKKNGVFDLYEGGKKWRDNETFTMRTLQSPKLYKDFVFDQVSNLQLNDDIYAYYDLIYIDKGLSRVMLCDSEVYIDCSKRRIQVAFEWSNERIELRLDQTGFPENTDLFLFVFDKSGRSSNGFKIVSAGLSASPPSNIIIKVNE